MCTYRRFSCVERSINCFLKQTYPNKELIIYNTDVYDKYLDNNCKLAPHSILIINNDKDFHTKEQYTNVGAIRRDALTFAGGDYVVTWDDDDIYMPWFMQQAMDRLHETRKPSFKPAYSWFNQGNLLQLVRNTMEASVVAEISKIREYGYLLETGKEGLSWYVTMRNKRELDELDTYCIPAYCFNWGDGIEMKAIHKQSGDINNPQNFENHKIASIDGVSGREIRIYTDEEMGQIYAPYLEYLIENQNNMHKNLLLKYIEGFTIREHQEAGSAYSSPMSTS